jgi:hypothetical protein
MVYPGLDNSGLLLYPGNDLGPSLIALGIHFSVFIVNHQMRNGLELEFSGHRRTPIDLPPVCCDRMHAFICHDACDELPIHLICYNHETECSLHKSPVLQPALTPRDFAPIEAAIYGGRDNLRLWPETLPLMRLAKLNWSSNASSKLPNSDICQKTALKALEPGSTASYSSRSWWKSS